MQTTIYRLGKQQGPVYSTGNYIQYPVINHNGKKSESLTIPSAGKDANYITKFLEINKTQTHKMLSSIPE